MTNFKDRVKETLARTEGASGSASSWFDEVLDEFVATLVEENKPWLGAAIEKRSLPQQRAFVTWPRHNRDQRSIMLTFWWDGTTLSTRNGKQRLEFDAKESLENYLINFLTKSAFPETLRLYKERCEQDQYGFLRVGDPEDMNREDAVALVPTLDQEKIVSAAVDAEIELSLKPEPFAGTTAYNANGGYHHLVSGGYVVAIEEHSLGTDGMVKLKGKRLPP